MLGFKSFETAKRTIQGIETMHMIKKGQVKLKNLSAPNNVPAVIRFNGIIRFCGPNKKPRPVTCSSSMEHADSQAK